MPRNAWGDEEVVSAPRRNAWGDEEVTPNTSLGRTLPAPERFDPSEGMTPAEKLLVGVGAAVARAGRGVGHLLPAWRDDPRLKEADENAALYEKYHPGGWGTAGEVVGDIAMGAVPVLKGGQVLTKALGALPRMAAVAPAAADIATNAAYSAVTSPEDRLEAAAWGGAGATAGRAANRLLGGVVTPGPEAQKLIERGVQPTVGQMTGESGRPLGRAISRLEESMQSVPLAGSSIRSTRERAMEQFRQAVRDAASPPGTTGAKTVAELGEAFSKAYDDVVRGAEWLPERYPFAEFKGALDDVVHSTSMERFMTPEQVEKAITQVHSLLNMAARKVDGLTPAGAQHVESRLKNAAFRYKSSPDPDAREFGQLLHDVATQWRQNWRSAVPGDVRKALDEVDAAYAKFVPVRRAAATGSYADPDAITPHVLLRAIRAGEAGRNKTQFLEGTRPQQALATAGAKVLTNKVQDSGTAERLGAFGLGMATANPWGAAAIGIPVWLYGNPVVQRYLTGQLSWQQMVQQHPRIAAQLGRALATAGAGASSPAQEAP